MAGQAYDKDAGTHTDRVVDNTQAGSEGKVLKEVNETPPKERLDIITGAGGRGQDVPPGFKSPDGSDATVVEHKQERVEKTYEDKVVQVGAVQVRDMAPGVDSMAAVKVQVRETTEKTTTEVTEKPGDAHTGGARGHGEAAAAGRGAGREGGREAGKEGEHQGREGERAGAAEAAEGKGKEDGREGRGEGEREGEAEAAEGKGREAAEAGEQAGKAQEGAAEAGNEGGDANRAAAEKAAEAAGAGGKVVDFQGGSAGDSHDTRRNPHKRQ